MIFVSQDLLQFAASRDTGKSNLPPCLIPLLLVHSSIKETFHINSYFAHVEILARKGKTLRIRVWESRRDYHSVFFN